MANRSSWLARGALSTVVLVGGFTTFKAGMWYAGRKPTAATAAKVPSRAALTPAPATARANRPAPAPATGKTADRKPAPAPATVPLAAAAPSTRPLAAMSAEKLYAHASPAVVPRFVRIGQRRRHGCP